jgi:hypothetical protein
MQDFKDRLFNYEPDPPPGMWDHISAELDEEKVAIAGLRRRSKFIFYGLTAAAALIIIFISSVFFNKTADNSPSGVVPTGNVIAQKVIDSLKLNNTTLDAIISSAKDKDQLAISYQNSDSKGKKYLVIEGPDCEPVKISPKVATLIDSADNQFPPRAVWNKKIEKWKQIMLTTTLSSTSTSLLDIAQLSMSIDNNE